MGDMHSGTKLADMNRTQAVRVLEELYRWYRDESVRVECSDNTRRGAEMGQRFRDYAYAISEGIDALEGQKSGEHLIADVRARITEAAE